MQNEIMTIELCKKKSKHNNYKPEGHGPSINTKKHQKFTFLQCAVCLHCDYNGFALCQIIYIILNGVKCIVYQPLELTI